MNKYLLVIITCGIYDVMVVEAKTQDKALVEFYKRIYEHMDSPISNAYFKELVDNCWKFDGRTPIDVLSDITKRTIMLFTELPGYRGTVIANELLEG